MIRQTLATVQAAALLLMGFAHAAALADASAPGPALHDTPGTVWCPSVWRVPWGLYTLDHNNRMVPPPTPTLYMTSGHVSLCRAQIVDAPGPPRFAEGTEADAEAILALASAAECVSRYVAAHPAVAPAGFPDGCSVVMHEDTQGAVIEGPSSGAAWALAILSALTGQPVRSDLVVTGAITPEGVLRPVSGLDIKAYGVAQAGLADLVIPAEPPVVCLAWPAELAALQERTGVSPLPVDTFVDLVAHAMPQTARRPPSDAVSAVIAACAGGLRDFGLGRPSAGASRCRAVAKDTQPPETWARLCRGEALFLDGVAAALHGDLDLARDCLDDARSHVPDCRLIRDWVTFVEHAQAGLALLADGDVEWPLRLAVEQALARIDAHRGRPSLMVDVAMDPGLADTPEALADQLATLFAATSVIESEAGVSVYLVGLNIQSTPLTVVAEYRHGAPDGAARLMLEVLPPVPAPREWRDVLAVDTHKGRASVRLPEGVELPVACAMRALLEALGAPRDGVGVMGMPPDGPASLALSDQAVQAIRHAAGLR